MLVVRPTASLAKRMKMTLNDGAIQSSTLLGDWFANDIVLGRKQYILAVCEHGRLAVLFNAAPYSEFHKRLPQEVAVILKNIGVSEVAIDAEINQMANVTFAKTNSRSILGTLNEYRFALEVRHMDFDTIKNMPFWLADMVSMAIPEHFPKDAVLNRFLASSSQK